MTGIVVYRSLVLNLLRFRLFAAFISLLLLTGFAHEILADCHRTDSRAQLSQTGESLPMEGDECDCVCHQSPSAVTTAGLQVGEPTLRSIIFLDGAEFLPDAMPRSIDHPPQLS